MHKLVEVTLKGKLNLAPIAKNPQRILDIGTGTGLWAVEIGMSTRWLYSASQESLADSFNVDRGQEPQRGGAGLTLIQIFSSGKYGNKSS